MSETISFVGGGAHPLSANRDGTLVSIEIGEGDDLLAFVFDIAQGSEGTHLAQFITTLSRFHHEARCRVPQAKGKAAS